MSSDYRRFYKKAIDERQGYVTKDGSWAAVPLMNSKKFVIIHEGEQVHISRNFDCAKTYILKKNLLKVKHLNLHGRIH